MSRRAIYVFGSNEAGIHGGGSARTANLYHGAQMGVGWGLTGDSFAIPTKDDKIRTLSLHMIAVYIGQFIEYAKEHPELLFFVTKVGCGLAGYTEDDIKPLFAGAPDNVGLPGGW
jgi:hypothetical protein